MQRLTHWNDFKKILCIRTDNLGDVLMTEPALRSLKKADPDRKLHLLTSDAGAAAAEMINSIEKTFSFNPIWIPAGQTDVSSFLEVVEMIRHEHYDAAVIFNVYSQNPLPAAMLCHLAGIKQVAGYCRENPYGLISAWFPDEEPLFRIKHEVLRQLDLAWHLGGIKCNQRIRLDIEEHYRESMQQKINPLCGDSPYILLHPGASEQRRQYSPDLFHEFLLMAANELDCQILVTGSNAETELVAEVAAGTGSNVHPVAGMFSLGELTALIQNSRLLISNNTGPVHIASATETPVVVLYAQTNPQHSPWMVDHVLLPFDVPQQKRSMNTIIRLAHEKSFNSVTMVEPQRILKAAESLMAKPNKADQKLNEYS